MTTLNMKRSSWSSGSGYVPSSSIGFCVARPEKGRSSRYVRPAAVTWYSCIASSSAACVFGGVRLISSARMICAKIGPFTNRSRRVPCSSSRISVPVMSDGMMSGVNWIRLNCRSRMSASVLMSSVLASPGTPVIRQWPPVKSAMSTCSTTSSCPTMTLRSSARMRSRPSATLSALTAATDESMWGSLVGEGVNDFVDAHAIRHRGVLDVAGIVLGVGPLPPVAHVGVEVDEDHRAAAVVEDRAQVLHDAAPLPGAPLQERAEARDLRVAVDLVETTEDGMILRHLDDLAIGEQLLHLTFEISPFERPVKIIHHRAASAQQELAQRCRVAVAHAHAARLDEVDPRILEEARVVERQQNRILDLNGGGRLDAAGQVLLRGGRVDPPGLAVEILRDPVAFEHVVILDAHEPPLQARVAVVGHRRQLRIDARQQHRHQRESREQHRGDRDPTGRLMASAKATAADRRRHRWPPL